VERFALLLPCRSKVGVQVIAVQEAPPADGRGAKVASGERPFHRSRGNADVYGRSAKRKPGRPVRRQVCELGGNPLGNELLNRVDNVWGKHRFGREAPSPPG
jgi:hypothetical protein